MGARQTPGRGGSVRYGAREFTAGEIAEIRAVVGSRPGEDRLAVAGDICRRLNWCKADGGLQDVACSAVLARMERDGLLPAVLAGRSRGYTPAATAAGDPGSLLEGTRGDLGPLRLVLVGPGGDSNLWSEVMARHHYLGCRRLVGAQLRYLVYADQRLLAALGFASPAWRVLDRDDFIGWDDRQRVARLRLVVNNSRFLIMPAVKVRMLASSILALAARRIAADWEKAYRCRPVLLETFVECDRFSGTSYQAANWIFIGETTGRGRFDRYHANARVFKSIWLYPLDRHFRDILCAPLPPEPEGTGRP